MGRSMAFGCGSGELVQYLRILGYDAYGCDIESSEYGTVQTHR